MVLTFIINCVLFNKTKSEISHNWSTKMKTFAIFATFALLATTVTADPSLKLTGDLSGTLSLNGESVEITLVQVSDSCFNAVDETQTVVNIICVDKGKMGPIMYADAGDTFPVPNEVVDILD